MARHLRPRTFHCLAISSAAATRCSTEFCSSTIEHVRVWKARFSGFQRIPFLNFTRLPKRVIVFVHVQSDVLVFLWHWLQPEHLSVEISLLSYNCENKRLCVSEDASTTRLCSHLHSRLFIFRVIFFFVIFFLTSVCVLKSKALPKLIPICSSTAFAFCVCYRSLS